MKARRDRNWVGAVLLLLAANALLALVGCGVLLKPGEIAAAGLVAGLLFAGAALELCPDPEPVVFWGVVAGGGLAIYNQWR